MASSVEAGITLVKDGRGRPTRIVLADAAEANQGQLEIRYHDRNVPRLVILPSGAAERFSFDSKSRLSGVELFSSDPEASGASATAVWTEAYVYDQAGNRIHSERRDASGNVTWRQDRAFDVQHHVVWESNPSLPSAGRSYTYDASGFLASVLDEEGRGVTLAPDELNRVATATRSGLDAQGNPVTRNVGTYAYAPGADILASVTDGEGRSTTYAYDDFGNVQSVSSPNLRSGGARWYRYDARGNLVARSDGTVAISYSYDGLDRLVSQSGTSSIDGSSVSYQYRYDESGFAGRLTSIIEPERTTQYAYDWAGRVTSETISQPSLGVQLSTGYAYDSNGDLQQITYPSGLTIRYVRDAATRAIVSVVNAADGTVLVSAVERVPFGPVTSATFGNGTRMTQTFTPRYEPTGVASGPLALAYTVSPSGDVGTVTDTSRDATGCVRNSTRAFGYDFMDRLASWSDTRNDAASCPLMTLGNVSAQYAYTPGTDAVASQSATAGGPLTLAFAYDQQGNVSAIGRYDASGATVAQAVCLRHDVLGHLVKVGDARSRPTAGGSACLTDADVSSVRAVFQYDWLSRRVARQVAGQWSYATFDVSGHPLSELLVSNGGGSASPSRDYVWMDGLLVAQVEHSSASASRVYYAHVDALGTPRALTGPDGTLVWSAYQRPSGEVGEAVVPDPTTGATVVTNLRLPGQHDERLLGSVGLQGPYYNWNRWYLPGVGRYLEPDPMALGGGFNTAYGVDWYNYAEENPLINTDPEGLHTWKCTKPLDALGGGPGRKNWTDWENNPLYHEYLCVDNGGKLDTPVCGGKTSTDGGWRGPGAPSRDLFKPDRCDLVDTNGCIEKCLRRAFDDPSNRGWYNVVSSNCQHWAESNYDQCVNQCNGLRWR